jgi:hypothetical protein
MAFYRKPSPLELTYLAQDSTDRSPFVNQYVIEGDGPLTLGELTAAVHHAAAAVPEARLRLRGHWAFRAWHDDGALPAVREVDATDWDGMSGSAAPFLGGPMNVRRGPVCEVVLLRGAPLRILFRTHHACMDGAGTLFFIRQVFTALGGEAPGSPTCKDTEWDVARRFDDVPRQVTLGGCPTPWKATLPAWTPGCHWRRFLYPGRPNAMGGKILAVINALAQEQQAPKVVIRMPADLRRYLEDGQFTASNCSAALDIDITGEHSPKKLQQMIISSMRQQQDLASILPAARQLHWFPLRLLRASDAVKQQLHGAGHYNYSATVTNLGKLDTSQFSAPCFTCTGMFGVPIPLELTPLTVAFIQYEEQTAIHVSIPAALGTPEDLQALSQRISDTLDRIEEPRPRVTPVPIAEASKLAAAKAGDGSHTGIVSAA